MSFVFCLLSFVFLHANALPLPLPPANQPPVLIQAQLTVEEVTCTETWLKLKTEEAEQTENDSTKFTLRLYRNDSLVAFKPYAGGDTLLYDAGLRPATDYAYWAEMVADSLRTGLSDTVTVTTMDTTSHDFTWQSWEFGGEGGSSSFYDVAIIDENDIWAVGEIYTADDQYNAAHWDGEKWKLWKIPSIICGNNSPIQSTIFTFFAFSSNDVWFSDGAELIHYNGANFKQDCSINPLLTGRINKIWGTSSSDFYVVGNNGMIAHYDGKEWRRIESNDGAAEVTTNIQDIWGCFNEATNRYSIMAVASEHFTSKKPKVLTIENLKYQVLPTDSIPYLAYGIWSPDARNWYISGYSVFRYYAPTHQWKRLGKLKNYFLPGIRGNDVNDLFTVGEGYTPKLFHWNGVSWRQYQEAFLEGGYYQVAFKEDLVVAVGYRANGYIVGPAKIALGKRY